MIRHILFLLGHTILVTSVQAALQTDLQHLEQKLKNLNVALQQQIPIKKFIHGWLVLNEQQMIGKATNNFVLITPPLVLPSNNEVLQIQVLSQYLTLGAFTQQNYTEVEQVYMEFFTPSDIKKHVEFLLSQSPANRIVQSLLKKQPFIQDELIGGNSASCGYQVLKNSFFILNTLQAITERHYNDSLEKTIELGIVADLFGSADANDLILNKKQPGTWRKFVIDQLRKNPRDNGEWLEQEEIYKLIEKYAKEYHLTSDNFSLLERTYEEAEFLSKVDEEYEVHFTLFKSTLEEVKKMTNGFHVFLLGDMSQDKRNGHWLALIVNIKDKKRQYIIADSTNAPRYQMINTRSVHIPITYKTKFDFNFSNIKKVIDILES